MICAVASLVASLRRPPESIWRWLLRITPRVPSCINGISRDAEHELIFTVGYNKVIYNLTVHVHAESQSIFQKYIVAISSLKIGKKVARNYVSFHNKGIAVPKKYTRSGRALCIPSRVLLFSFAH